MSWAKKMIDRALLEGYGTRDGVAVVAFADGRELQLVPEWRNDSVRRILSVRLLGQGQVIAQVVSGCFEPLGVINQPELGSYCTFAIDLEREVYRHYRLGKISEDEWQKRFRGYWKIVIKSRQIATALSQSQLPTSPVLNA
jgi:hypothetical protein